MATFEETLKTKCAQLDEMLCEQKKSDAVMKEFATKRDVLGSQLWSDSAKLMVDGYKSQLLQAIVMIEDIKTFINSDDSQSEFKDNMLDQLNEWHSALKTEYEKNKRFRDIVRNYEKGNGVL